MEKKHRDLINKELPELACTTYDVQNVVNKLFEKKIINKWMKDYILDSSLSQLLQAERLYLVIQGRGPLAFGALCKILDETNLVDARKILTASKKMNDDQKPAILRLNVSNSANDLYVTYHPDRKRMDVDEKNTYYTDVYHMGSNPKGHAFILNINKTVGRDERYGSNVDLENLNKLFKGLGYSVESKVDLTKKETIEAIEEFINNCQHKKIDSIVVFIMSHGEAGKDSTRSSDILTSDGNNINTDWLIEKFGSDKISKSIPKLFFIQACRGENSDFGRSPISILNNNLLQNDSSSVGNVVNRRYENVFIAYATVPGYNAKRHPVNGSWFVQTLCEVIRNNAWKDDIHSMMRLVDQEVESLNCNVNGFQTVEWSYRGFNKKFYFNPGLYDDCTSNNVPMNTQVNPVDT